MDQQKSNEARAMGYELPDPVWIVLLLAKLAKATGSTVIEFSDEEFGKLFAWGQLWFDVEPVKWETTPTGLRVHLNDSSFML